MRDAFRKMRQFLMHAKGLTEDEAISLMSIAVDFGITQVVDGNWGVHAIVKKAIFAELDTVVTAKDAILASNTSSMPIIRFAQATGRPDRVLGIHFFNPAPVQPLVELVVSELTDPAVVDAMDSFATDVLGKVTSGQADAGLVYVTDAKNAGEKVTEVTFPEAAAVVNVYPIATLTAATQPELATRFVELVTGPEGQQVLSAAGFKSAP